MGCCATVRTPEMKPELMKLIKSTSEKSSKHWNIRNSNQKSKSKLGLSTNIGSDSAHPSLIIREKNSSQVAEIQKALSSHFLFKRLSKENLKELIRETKLCEFEAEQIIFAQGDKAFNFYIISEGTVEITINNSQKGTLSKGECFGELALIHDSTRTGTVKTCEPTLLWVIDRDLFKSAVSAVSSNFHLENSAFLETLEFFQKLSPELKEKFLEQAAYHEFSDGQAIIKEGDPGTYLYIIKSGRVKCIVEGLPVRFLESGEIFCEQAALFESVRTATGIAVGKVSLLSIGNSETMIFFRNSLKELYKNTIRIAIENDNYLKYLSSNQQETLISLLKINYFETAEILIQKSTKIGKNLYFVLRGEIEHNNFIYTHSQIFGISELMKENFETIQEDIIAKSPIVLAEITQEELEKNIGGRLRRIIASNEIISVLKKVQIFKSLPMSKLESLSNFISIVNFSDGFRIFSENDLATDFYIVKEGGVEISKGGVFIRFISKNDYFGERAILLDQFRTADATAMGRCECWTLSKQDFMSIIDESIRIQLQKRLDLQNDSIKLEQLIIAKHLANGMYGSVFLVLHKETSLKYALKAVHKDRITNPKIFELLQMERKILLQIEHPFIIKLVKTFKDKNRIYYLMEFIEGIELYQVMQEINLLNNESAKFYTGCVLLILEHIHEKHICYRDLKPENVMIDIEGYPRLIDFGTSKMTSERMNTVIGTPHYMAPEVISGFGYDFSCDLWSLGVMLFEFIVGEFPFGDEEEDTYAIYESIINGKLKFPKEFREIEARPFIEKLLDRDPKERGTPRSLKANRWLNGVNWDYLLGKQVKAPFIPKIIEKNFEETILAREDTLGKIEIYERQFTRPLEISNGAKDCWDLDF